MAAARECLSDAEYRHAEPEGSAWTLDQEVPCALEVVQLLVDGRSNQEIADALFVSPYPPATHLTNIMKKLGVDSGTAAAAWDIRQGIA